MRVLDIFCGAGGAALGYAQVGFEVVGVDIKPQPNFPFKFIQADALEYLRTAELSAYNLIHASPPCQKFTAMRHAPGTKEHLDLVAPTRELLIRSGKPYCIENVPGSPLIDAVTLCGSMFGLQAPDGAALRRHRLFEASFSLTAPSACRHVGQTIGIYGAHVRDRRRSAGTNHKSGSNRPWAHAYEAMGVPVGSMTLAELSEAIPPAYSQFIAKAFLQSQRDQADSAQPIAAQ